ncbi:hypothetical protein [Nitrospira sp. BLG_2]|uniref:hypothetical protein n=1 Tax=Nitrospira sp. BLG_2 TaxID=3397507 RepID=UPI003B995A5A
MKPSSMHFFTVWAILQILTACATNDSAPSTVPSTTSATTSQMRSSDRMFYWLEEARELHAMASHRDREAELMLQNKPGPATNEFVKQMRQLTRRLHQAATYADAQANEAKQEILPDMVQQFHSTLR